MLNEGPPRATDRDRDTPRDLDDELALRERDRPVRLADVISISAILLVVVCKSYRLLLCTPLYIGKKKNLDIGKKVVYCISTSIDKGSVTFVSSLSHSN